MNKDYDAKIRRIQNDIDAIISTKNLTTAKHENKRLKLTSCTTEPDEGSLESEAHSSISSRNKSIDSSSKRINLDGDEMQIQFDTGYEASSADDSHRSCRNVQVSYERASEEEDSESDTVQSGHNHEEDDETVVDEMQQYYASRIKRSKLYMSTQGFQIRSNAITHGAKQGLNTNNDVANSVLFDPNYVNFKGRTFYKNRCYRVKEEGSIVGIKHFLSQNSCQCVLIAKFEDTLLGTNDDRIEYEADYMLNSYVQVFKCEKEMPLTDLDIEMDEIGDIPLLIYQPQTLGDWYSFGYFYDRNAMKKKGQREVLTSLEVFAGAGGSLQG